MGRNRLAHFMDHSIDHPPGDLAIDDPKAGAVSVGLRYVGDDRPGIRRLRAGRGFTYQPPEGGRLPAETVRRIRSLAIPPAWTNVWICPYEDGHLQATGRDARGRKQYRYHPLFREVREGTKFEHMIGFASALPAIRAKVSADMALRGLSREKVLATVVHLLETTLIRVGNDDYARQNRSYGLTTLKNRHVAVNGSEVRFQFTGKSGKQWSLAVRDRRIARIIRACQDLPGQDLLEYVDEDGSLKRVTSGDVNDYLREITGREITAKDFRTWAGTVLMAVALLQFPEFRSETEAKRNIRESVKAVAALLGNTPTICRKCYVHPELFKSYLEGELGRRLRTLVQRRQARSNGTGLKPEEAAVLSLLRARLNRPIRINPLARRSARSRLSGN